MPQFQNGRAAVQGNSAVDKRPKSDYNIFVRFRTIKGGILLEAQADTRLSVYNSAWKKNDKTYQQMARSLGITETTLWILYAMRFEPEGITQRHICEFMHEPKQTINSALKKMEADGLLTMQSGESRRTKLVRLTPAGHALAQKTADRVLITEQRALAQFSEAEFQQFCALLNKMSSAMMTIFPDTDQQ